MSTTTMRQRAHSLTAGLNKWKARHDVLPIQSYEQQPKGNYITIPDGKDEDDNHIEEKMSPSRAKHLWSKVRTHVHNKPIPREKEWQQTITIRLKLAINTLESLVETMSPPSQRNSVSQKLPLPTSPDLPDSCLTKNAIVEYLSETCANQAQMTIENFYLIKSHPVFPYKAQLHPCLLASVDVVIELRAFIQATDRFHAWRNKIQLPDEPRRVGDGGNRSRSATLPSFEKAMPALQENSNAAKLEQERLAEFLAKLKGLRDGFEGNGGQEGLRHGWLNEPLHIEEAGESATL